MNRNVEGSSLKRDPIRIPSHLSDVPVIGCYFPQDQEISRPDGYRDFLEPAAEHSPYTLVMSIQNRAS